MNYKGLLQGLIQGLLSGSIPSGPTRHPHLKRAGISEKTTPNHGGSCVGPEAWEASDLGPGSQGPHVTRK